jgi:hypothetical protein
MHADAGNLYAPAAAGMAQLIKSCGYFMEALPGLPSLTVPTLWPGRARIAELYALTRAVATARAKDVLAMLEIPVGLRS